MQWKISKNTDKYYWTQYMAGEMLHCGLSEQKVLGVIRYTERIVAETAPTHKNAVWNFYGKYQGHYKRDRK